MGITSFTLSGLGVDAAASGVSGTVPRLQERVKAPGRDLGPGAGNSRLSGGNHQLLPDKETISVGKGVFFENRILRYAEAGGDPGECVPFAHDVALLLTRRGDRWRARGGGDNRERWSRRQVRLHRVVLTRRQEQDRRDRETGDPDRAWLVTRGQKVRRPVARDANSSGHV